MTFSTTLAAILAAASLGQCLLSISLLLVRKDPHKIYAPLIVFFAFFSLNFLTTCLALFIPENSGAVWYNFFEISSFIGLLALSPALWIYLRNITSSRPNPPFYKDFWHFFPFGIGLLVGAFLLSLPTNLFEQMVGRLEGPKTPLLMAATGVLFFTMVFWAVQSGFYLVVIIRRLLKHQHHLKQVFSSTEHRELMWIYTVASLLVITLVLSVLNIFFSLIDPFQFIVDIFDLILISVLSHWGLRQQIALQSEIKEQEVNTIPLAETEASSAKYERSPLTEQHISRIEKRILELMETQKLHLNPNLSLSDLARAVSEPANYVSQTLNGHIGQSFFDFVNAWRVKEAQQHILNSDNTFLDIAYSVGFNSRSSFYKSFKRETGMTPSAYRSQAHPKTS